MRPMSSVTVPMKNMAHPAWLLKKAPTSSRYSGTLARQFIMGTMRMVAILARSSGMARVAMTPGMAQPPT